MKGLRIEQAVTHLEGSSNAKQGFLKLMLLASFVLSVTLAIVFSFGQTQPEPEIVQFALIVPKTLGKKLPDCVSPADAGDCPQWLYRVQRQDSGRKWVNFDMWALNKTGNKKFHAHVWRIENSDDYIWMFYGARIWLRYMRQWSQLDATIKGPVGILDLPNKPAMCNRVGENALVFIPVLDSGQLQQTTITEYKCNTSEAGIRTDQCYTASRLGPWPDGSTMQCPNGKTYELRSRWGGPNPANWTYTAGEKIEGPEFAGSIDPGIPPNVWDDYVAPDRKICPNVPINTTCPN